MRTKLFNKESRKQTLLLILMTPIVLLTGCITIRGSGSSGNGPAISGSSLSQSTSRPSSDAQIDKKNRERLKSCYEQEKTTPRPVRFTCDQAVKILNAKDRLNAWPAKCQRKMAFQKKRLDTECKAKVDKQKARTEACQEKHKILMNASRKSCKVFQAQLVAGTVGAAAGVVLGVIVTLIIYQFVPAN